MVGLSFKRKRKAGIKQILVYDLAMVGFHPALNP
jgi:hypothetical protein